MGAAAPLLVLVRWAQRFSWPFTAACARRSRAAGGPSTCAGESSVQIAESRKYSRCSRSYLRTGEKTRLLAPISGSHTTIENFLDDHSAQCAAATKAFEQIVDKLQALVEKVCKDVTTRARVDPDAPISTSRDAATDGEGGKGRQAPAKHRTKSMSQVKEEHAHEAARIIRSQMGAIDLDGEKLPPLPTTLSCGRTWGTMAPL